MLNAGVTNVYEHASKPIELKIVIMSEATGIIMFFIFVIGGTVGLIYYGIFTRHKEKMILIEKGADPKLFQTEPRKKGYFYTVIIGIEFVCLSMGIGLGFVFDNVMYNWGWVSYRGDHPAPYFMSIFLMIGVGFLLSFYASKKLNK